jgi:chemotaxis family two-component system sensor kinase Cph1
MAERAMELEAERQSRWHPDADVLVHEAYHRISNHLHLLVSLIGIRAREHPDPAVREELMQVRRRILAMARLHGELQQTRDDQSLDIGPYLERLGEDLRLSFASEAHAGLRIDFDIEAGKMDSEKAITLALIVNELVTNAMKYAGQGRIVVRLDHQPDGRWRLMVIDDGPGFSPSGPASEPGHGLDLIRLLARKLRGDLAVEPVPHGAALSVSFP